MKNYVKGYENQYNDGNKNRNVDENAASGLVSYGPILDSITMPQSSRGGLGNNNDGAAAAAHYLSTHRTIYLPYKYPIKDLPKTALYKNWHFRLV